MIIGICSPRLIPHLFFSYYAHFWVLYCKMLLTEYDTGLFPDFCYNPSYYFTLFCSDIDDRIHFNILAHLIPQSWNETCQVILFTVSWTCTTTLNWAKAVDLCKNCPWGPDIISLASAAQSWNIGSYKPEPNTDKIWSLLQHPQSTIFLVTNLFSLTVFLPIWKWQLKL